MKKDNSGALFKNDRKQSDSHPDYTGKCMINGIEYYMNAWINQSKSGVNYMSFSFKEIVNRSDESRKAINQGQSMNNYSNPTPQESYSNNTGPMFSGGVSQDNLVDNFEDDIPF